MKRILVVFGTRQGHTAHLAARIADGLRSAGHDVEVRDLHESWPFPVGYDAIVVGASVHARGFEKEVTNWAAQNADALLGLPNAFFSVSLTAANHDDKSRAELDAIIDAFVEHTSWRPQHIAEFAGELAYSKYNWLLKRVMRWIAKHESGGQYQDMSHDYDLTDYDAVDAFATQLAETLTTSNSASPI
jgi:menaquinone-dependent protoporphyrinogen oxidase